MSDLDEGPETEIAADGENADQTSSLADGPTTSDGHAEEASSFPPGSPTTGGHVRIEGVEAAVAAGHRPPSAVVATDDDDLVPAWPVQLPDWRDPPTREVPRILLDPSGIDDHAMPGPVWREIESDWQRDDSTFADIVSEGAAVPEHAAAFDEPDPFSFDFEIEARPSAPTPVVTVPDEPDETEPLATEPVPDEPAPGSARRPLVVFAGRARPGSRTEPKLTLSERLHLKEKPYEQDQQDFDARPKHEAKPRHAASNNKRDPIIATITGVVVGLLVLLCLDLGPAYMLALSTILITTAAAECYLALRTVRFRPAAFLGLAAVPAAVLSAYFAGPGSIAIVAVAFVIATFSWFLVRSKRNRLLNVSATIGVWAWIGLLGAFAGLLLSPHLFPDRHGVTYMLGALEATVAYDVGGYAFGSWIGKHKLAPSISPNKTIEGLIGGSVAALAISLALVTHQAPWTVPHAFWLGIIVAVVAPLGDLAESMIKRDIGVKDMGSVLPAHGGVLDRIDALLFVIPATYCLLRLVHG
jgi:CDP-diglyceride synthetase